jgi:hypothetical protein
MRSLLIVIMILALSAGAFAQQQKGDMEIQFLGMYMTTTGGDFNFSMGQISGSIGHFFTDNLELGVAPTITITTTPSTELIPTPPYYRTVSKTTTTFGGSVFGVYSFLLKDAKTVPYAGARFYKQDFSVGESSAGLSAGVKYFISKKTAIDGNVNYLFSLTKGDSNSSGILLFGVGFSFLF